MRSPVLATCAFVLAAVVVITFGPTHIGAANPGSNAGSNDTWEPDLAWNIKSFRFMFGSDSKFKIKTKRFKSGGKKTNGIEFKGTEKNSFGFFDTRLDLGFKWSVEATFHFPKTKKLLIGQTFGALEVDFETKGGSPTEFIVGAVVVQSDGLSTFVNENGSGVGSQMSYPGATAVDIMIGYEAGVMCNVSSRAHGTSPWNQLYSGSAKASFPGPFDLGFGGSNLPKGGKFYVSDILVCGEIFKTDGLRDKLTKKLDEAVAAEDKAGELLPSNFFGAATELEKAIACLESIQSQAAGALSAGTISKGDAKKIRKLAGKAIKQDDKVLNKIDPDGMGAIPSFGNKERKRLRKADKQKIKLGNFLQTLVVSETS